ncbi:MAG TPA: multiheme c-type cytochrome [Thermodesulfobacteriota bacterium]
MMKTPYFRTFFSLIGLLFLAFLAAPGQANAGERLTIVYTGGMKGELEPCGCSPETQSGGLARLSTYISQNKDKLGPVILVDAGNALAEETPQGRLKSEAMMRSFGAIGYDAVAFFEKGTPLPLKELKPLLGKKVKVVSDMAGQPGSALIRKKNIQVNVSVDPKAVKKGRLNVLLTDRKASEVSAAGWDVVISSSGEEIKEPVKTDGAVYVSGYLKGEKLGVLTLELDRKGRVTTYSHRWQALGKDVADDPKVRGILNEYDMKVAELAKAQEKKPVSEGPYLGAERCMECHQPHYEIWLSTKHSTAFSRLEEVGKSRDPECVVCHSVGFREEGGFISREATPKLANVQCEACHGPGREHAKDFSPMRPLGDATERVCLKCHTPENSPQFDFKEYYERIKH